MVHKNPGVLFKEKNLIPQTPRINPSTPPHEEETKNMPKGQRSSEQSTKQSPIAPQQKERQILKELGVGGVQYSWQRHSIFFGRS